MRLWSGRSIPKWFITSFYVTIIALSFIEALVIGFWAELRFLLGMWAAFQSSGINSAKPKPLDDFA